MISVNEYGRRFMIKCRTLTRNRKTGIRAVKTPGLGGARLAYCRPGPYGPMVWRREYRSPRSHRCERRKHGATVMTDFLIRAALWQIPTMVLSPKIAAPELESSKLTMN